MQEYIELVLPRGAASTKIWPHLIPTLNNQFVILTNLLRYLKLFTVYEGIDT